MPGVAPLERAEAVDIEDEQERRCAMSHDDACQMLRLERRERSRDTPLMDDYAALKLPFVLAAALLVSAVTPIVIGDITVRTVVSPMARR